MSATDLRGDDSGSWMVVFEPDELHLYIECVAPGTSTDATNWIRVDDFFTRRPTGSAHRQAIERLVELLRRALDGDLLQFATMNSSTLAGTRYVFREKQ